MSGSSDSGSCGSSACVQKQNELDKAVRELVATVQDQTLALQKRIFEQTTTEELSKKLAVFSIGLGLAELFAPNAVAKISGLTKRNSAMIRLCGLREIGNGVAILTQGKKPTSGMWSRVAGDAMDLGALLLSSFFPSSNKIGVTFATLTVLGITAIDLITAKQLAVEEGAAIDHSAA